MKRWKRDTIV